MAVLDKFRSYTRMMVDEFFRATKAFRVPVFTGAPTLNGAEDVEGYLAYKGGKLMVYKGAGVWEAVGGAVFSADFTHYLPVNNTGIPNNTTFPAGTPLETYIIAAGRKASPAVYNQPSVGFSGAPAPAVVEVGTAIAITFALVFNQNDAGAETSRTITKNGSPLPGTTDNIVVSTSAITYIGTVFYAQGAVKNDSLGSPDPSGRIGAGSKNGSLSYVGSYRIFFGATDVVIDASNARTALGSSFLASGSTVNFQSGATYKNFYIWVPPGKTLTSWVDSATNADLKAASTNSPLTIPDNGAGSLAGTLYKVSAGSPFPGPNGDLFKFIIS